MPDLITHFAAAYFLKIPRGWSRFRVPFYFGAILPDLLTRSFVILYPPSDSVVYSFHTPVVSVVVCLLIAQFFEKGIRSGMRTNLLLGITLHFGLDILQRHVIVPYFWFFPFGWKTFELGLFWPEDSLNLVPLWVSLMLVIEAVIQVKKDQQKKEDLNL